MINWTDGNKRPVLTIDQDLPGLLELVDKNQVVLCKTLSSTDKISRIGQALHLHNPNLEIMLAQQFTTICRAIALDMAKELGCKVGEKVGLFLRDDKKGNQNSRLMVLVASVLQETIAASKTLPPGLFILDEVNPSLQMDFVFGLLLKYLINAPHTKILIISAQVSKFSKSFPQAPILQLKEPSYFVKTEIKYLQKNEHHKGAAIRVVFEIINLFFKQSLFVEDRHGQNILITKGTCIVLLFGIEPIEAFMRALQSQKDLYKNRLELVSSKRISTHPKFIKGSTPEGVLRIVCESSRSVFGWSDVIGVVDTLRINEIRGDTRGLQNMQKVPISQLQRDQAKYLAGQSLGIGTYFPLACNEDYEQLPEFPTPPIDSHHLHEMFLQIAAAGLSIRQFPFLEFPTPSKMDATIKFLKDLEALNEEENITPLGKKLTQIPTSPEFAKILLAAKKYHVFSEALVIIAFLTKKVSIFTLPTNAKRTAPNMWVSNSPNDLAAILIAYQAYQNAKNTCKNSEEVKEWCGINKLDYFSILKAEKLIFQMDPKHHLEGKEFDLVSISKAFISGLFDQISVYDGKLYNNPNLSFEILPESSCKSGEPLILVGLFKRFHEEGQKFELYAEIAVPIYVPWVIEMVPHLCSAKSTGTYFYDDVNHRICEETKVFFKELEIGAAIKFCTDRLTARKQFNEWLIQQCLNCTLKESSRATAWGQIIQQNYQKLQEMGAKGTISIAHLRMHFSSLACHLNEISLNLLKLPSDEALEKWLIPGDNITILGLKYPIAYPSVTNHFDRPRIKMRDNFDWPFLFVASATSFSVKRMEIELSLQDRTLLIRWDEFQNINLRGQDLSGLDLRGIDFSLGSLQGAKLHNLIFDSKTYFPRWVLLNFLNSEGYQSPEDFMAALNDLTVKVSKHPQRHFILQCLGEQVKNSENLQKYLCLLQPHSSAMS